MSGKRGRSTARSSTDTARYKEETRDEFAGLSAHGSAFECLCRHPGEPGPQGGRGLRPDTCKHLLAFQACRAWVEGSRRCCGVDNQQLPSLLIRVIAQQHVVNRTCREAIGEVRQSIDAQIVIAECLGRDCRAGFRWRDRRELRTALARFRLRWDDPFTLQAGVPHHRKGPIYDFAVVSCRRKFQPVDLNVAHGDQAYTLNP